MHMICIGGCSSASFHMEGVVLMLGSQLGRMDLVVISMIFHHDML